MWGPIIIYQPGPINSAIFSWLVFFIVDRSGQIIATSHDLTPNGGLVREIPLFQGNPGWWNIIIWPELILWKVSISIIYIMWFHHSAKQVILPSWKKRQNKQKQRWDSQFMVFFFKLTMGGPPPSYLSWKMHGFFRHPLCDRWAQRVHGREPQNNMKDKNQV